MTRQTDLTTRFTKESYLFLLVYNRAPNDSKWNPFLFESAIPIPPRVVSKDARFTAKQIQLKKKKKGGGNDAGLSKYIYIYMYIFRVKLKRSEKYAGEMDRSVDQSD